MFQTIDNIFDRIYGFIGSVIGVTIGLFAVLISLDLGLKILGLPNLSGLQEIIEYSLFASVFLGAPWVLRMNAHIRIDLIIAVVPPIIRAIIEVALNILGIMICLILVAYGWLNLLDAYASGAAQRQFFIVQEWWLIAVFVTAMKLCAIEFVLRLFRKEDRSTDAKENAKWS
ncbi:MAG: TRAP transporter small permease [Rhizobiaceae bacterium]